MPDKRGALVNSRLVSDQFPRWRRRKKIHKTNPVKLNKCDRTGQVSAIKFPAPAKPNKQPENTKGRVGEEALSEFLEAGYTQQNALDVVLGVSLASLCNYANNLANTPINPELQPYA